MQWALLGIIVIALFLISGRYPKIAFSALGALVFGVATLVILSEDDARLYRRQISAEQIEIGNFTVQPAYAGSYRISGRIVNRHDDALLKGFMLNVVMQDCASTADDDCLIVGQSSERIVTSIPPGQARDFSTNAYFGEPAVNGEKRWQFTVSEPRS